MILISGVELETVFEGRDLLENGDILRQFFGMIWQINFHDYDWNWGRSSGKRKNCALRIRASLTIWETQKIGEGETLEDVQANAMDLWPTFFDLGMNGKCTCCTPQNQDSCLVFISLTCDNPQNLLLKLRKKTD